MRFIGIFVAIFWAVLPACAETKIVTVDVNRILNESVQAQMMKKELDKLQQDAKVKIEARRKALDDAKTKLGAAALKEDSDAAEKLRAQSRELERFVKDTQEELNKEFMKRNRALKESTIKTIQQYAEREKIDLVLDRSDENHGPVLYGQSTVDVTSEIVKEMNR